MNKEMWMSAKFNNILAVTLGIPTLALGIFGFKTPIVSEFWDFVGMSVFAAVY